MNFRSSSVLDRRIWALTLPAIASNITVPLLGLCDTAITGHLGDGAFLAAVAAGGTIFNVVLWLCGFLRMGTTGLTAEAYGSRNPKTPGIVFWRSVCLASLIGILIIIFRTPLLHMFMSVISPGPDVGTLASAYFNICVWGIPPLLVTLSVNGWFIGMQDTLRPMIISVSMNLINVGASTVAAFPLEAGFTGIAIGTLAANWCGLLIAVIMAALYSRKKKILTVNAYGIFREKGFARFFKVSGDLFFRSACIMGVSLAVTSFGARMGDLTLAVNAVMLQFFIFFSYFMDGFSFAGEAMCGKYAGARDLQGLRSTVVRLLFWSAVMALLFFIIYLGASSRIVALLTDVYEVRVGVDTMRLFTVILPPVAVWAFIFDGFFVGLTATRRMFLTTLGAASLFLLAIIAGIPEFSFGQDPIHENQVLWTAFLLFLFARGAGLAAQLPAAIKNVMGKSAL